MVSSCGFSLHDYDKKVGTDARRCLKVSRAVRIKHESMDEVEGQQFD